MAAMMAPIIPRTNRPPYTDYMFREQAGTHSSSGSSHRSADSVSSSVNSQTDSRYDAGSKYQKLRTLTPALEDDNEDRSSIRSFASSFTFRKPKWRLLHKLHRRNHTATEAIGDFQTRDAYSTPRKPSISTLNQFHTRQNSSMLALGPRSPVPTLVESPQELSSRRCYYSIARNCSGWVIGGHHGDACDSCLVSRHAHSLWQRAQLTYPSAMDSSDHPDGQRIHGSTFFSFLLTHDYP